MSPTAFNRGASAVIRAEEEGMIAERKNFALERKVSVGMN